MKIQDVETGKYSKVQVSTKRYNGGQLDFDAACTRVIRKFYPGLTVYSEFDKRDIGTERLVKLYKITEPNHEFMGTRKVRLIE